jgi:ankyrin repeat protein
MMPLTQMLFEDMIVLNQMLFEDMNVLRMFTFIDPNPAKTAGVTALFGAAISDLRVDVNGAIADGITPLYFAIRRGMRKLSGTLLTRSHIHINMCYQEPCRETLLHMAANHAYMIQTLLQKHLIHVNAVDVAHETTLRRAVLMSNENSQKSIARRNEVHAHSVAAKGGMSLHLAIAQKSHAIALLSEFEL